MPIQPFNSVGGFSVGTGNSLVIDRNAGATFNSLYVTNGATFNSSASFVRGLTTQSLYVSQGATFASTVKIDAGLDVHSISVSQGATFTSQARFVAGLSSGGTVAVQSLSVDQGATFASRATFVSGLTSLGTIAAQSLSVDQGATFTSRARFVAGLSSGGTVAVQSLSVDAGATFNTVNATTYRNLPVASAGASGVASFADHNFTVSSTGHVSVQLTVTGSGDPGVGVPVIAPIVTGLGSQMAEEARNKQFAWYLVDDTKIGKTGDSALQTYVYGDFTVFGDGVGKTFGHNRYTFAVDPKQGSVLLYGGHTTQFLDGTTGHTAFPRISLVDMRNEFGENNIYSGTIFGLTAPTNFHEAANKWYVDSKFVGGVTFTNISVVGITATNLLVDGSATFGSTVSVAGTLTAHSLFVSNGATFGTVSATTYRNLPQASNSVTGVASFKNTQFTVDATGHVSITGNEFYFDKDLTAAFGPNKTFGKYVDGDTIPAKGKTAREVIELALFSLVPPGATLTSTVPSSGITFGEFSPNITLNLAYTIKTLGATASKLEFYHRRGSGNFGSVFNTYTTGLPNSSVGSVSIVHSPTGDTLSTVSATPPTYSYQCVVTDTLGATSLAIGTSTTTVLNVTAAAYVQPTIVFSITGPSAFSSPTGQEVTTGNDQLRMLGNRVSRLYARVTRQSPLIDITGLAFQFAETSSSSGLGGVNSPTWNLIDGVTFAANSPSTPDISHAGHTFSAGSNFANTIKFGRYRIRYTDTFRTEANPGGLSAGSGLLPEIDFKPVIYWGKSTVAAVDFDSIEDISPDINQSGGAGLTTNRRSFFTNSFSQLVSSSTGLTFASSSVGHDLWVIIPKDVATSANFTTSAGDTINPPAPTEFVAKNEYGATGTFLAYKVGNDTTSTATVRIVP